MGYFGLAGGCGFTWPSQRRPAVSVKSLRSLIESVKKTAYSFCEASIQTLFAIGRQRLLISRNLGFVAGQRRQVIGERVEAIVSAVVLFALLLFRSVIDVHAKFDAVNAASPAQIVDELDAGCVVDVGAVRASAQYSKIGDVDLRQRAHRRLRAIVVDPLRAKLVQQATATAAWSNRL